MASSDAQTGLHQLLGGIELAALRQRLRKAYADAAPGYQPTALRLSGLAPHEAEVLQSLSGRPPRPTRSIQVDLTAISDRLRAAGLAEGLREALELLDGPISTRHDRDALAARWASVVGAARHPSLVALLAQPRALGLVKRLAGDPQAAQALCDSAAAVLRSLPVGGMPRAQLAAHLLGDAHALDDGRPVATVVLAALRHAATGEDAESARTLWASQGVAVNELARPALVLNLMHPEAPAAHGEPTYWSLRRLLRQPPAWQVRERDVFVCENPNLLALAADVLGSRCAPLLCTEGMPAAAQRALLHQLLRSGARLHYHGDFDWPGLIIGNQMMTQLGARAWRFGCSDYQAAVADSTRPDAALVGSPVAAVWDESLAPAMRSRGCAVPEEALFDILRGDLAA